MKQAKLLILFLLFFAINTFAAESNRIYIPNVQTNPGKAVSLPVHLDNTSDIVALEFTLTLPDSRASLNVNNSTLTDRVKAHELMVKSIGNNAYKVTVYSMSNAVIGGQSGKLINLTLNVPSSWAVGDTKALQMSDAVLSLRNGENVMTGFDGGNVTIIETPHADIIPKNINLTGTSFKPGETITIGWTVENIGQTEATGGWGALVTLTDQSGATFGFEKVFENTKLSAGGTLMSNIEFNLPATLGIEGLFNVKVELVPSSSMNELVVDQGNNTTQTTNFPGTMGKTLSLNLPSVEVKEDAGTFKLSVGRSGYRGYEETVKLTSSNSSRVSVPQTVVIPAGQASVSLDATVIDNNIWDKNETITVKAQLEGYDDTEAQVTIVDDETAVLTLTTDKLTYNEGETVNLTITASSSNPEDVTLMIGATPNGKFTYEATQVLKAGETSLTVPVTITDNNKVEQGFTAKFTVNATNYTSCSETVNVEDDDTPELELILSPKTISEADGPQCVMATIRKTTNVDKAVNIRLFDDSNNNIIYSVSQIGLAAGQQEYSFFLGVVDNTQVEGSRTYTVNAGVYYQNGVLEKVGRGSAKASLNVTDDDGPTLTLTTNNVNMKEGSANTVLTVSRNTSTTEALTVNISSNHNNRLEFAKTATIAAGQSKATVNISVNSDDTTTDNIPVTFTASAEGFTAGNCNAVIVNQTLPDVSNLTITPAQTSILFAGTTKAVVTLTNSGVATLPEGAKVYALFSTSRSFSKSSCSKLGEKVLTQKVGAGETVSLEFDLALPELTGVYYLYSMVELPDNVQEITDQNNASQACQITLEVPFTVAVTVDKSEYKVGENITINGKAKGVNGYDTANGRVWLMYNWNGHTYKAHEVTLDEKGNFILQYTVPKTQPGNYTIVACHYTTKEADDADKASFFAYGWRTSTTTFMNKSIERGTTYSGSFNITNDCEKPLTNVNITCADVPDDATLTWKCPTIIEAFSTVTVNYNFTPTEQTTEQVTLTATLSADQCDDLTMTGVYVAYNPFPDIKASVSHITTTATKGTQKKYQLNIGNLGKGASGTVTLALPSFMKALSGTNIPSLAYGEYATVTLAINIDENANANTKLTGQIGVNCENGNGFALPYDITVVSEATGLLRVDVCDEYTYYNEGAPQVKNANVVIRNYTTGEKVYDSTTNELGYIEQTLTEGYYKLSVTADGHESYNGTILVDPGVTNVKTVNLAIIDDIKIEYTVVETEVEDVYEIVTTTTFETAVPKPQLKIKTQGNIDGDNLDLGQSLVYSVVVTNEGLITAKNVYVAPPYVEDDYTGKLRPMKELSVKYLTPSTFDLRPKESAVVTFELTRVSQIDLDPCTAQILGTYEYNCGTDMKSGKMSAGVIISQTCYDGYELPELDLSFDFDDFEIYEGQESNPDFVKIPNVENYSYDDTKNETAPVIEEEDEGIVIAKVKLQFNQRLTMTRQAFRGTLTIENGTTGQMKDIILTLTETDSEGKVATSHEFQVNNESIEGFGGKLEGPWTLDAKKTGTATILYIPTKYAAPFEPVDYSFGGQISFIDPTTGNRRLRDLTEQTLTVKPSPNLNLTYFMQRDVIGDDPLTAAIEPMEEAEFSLIINNVGYGEATNVNMVTQQPQIIDNEQGLLIDFEITRALLNGKSEVLAMGDDVVTPFGNIPAQSQSYAQWFFTSTLMGHFVDYKVEATHLTSYDNPDLTLLNDVTIHELTHSVNVPGKDIKGFLCNDEDDDEDLPDAIYFTNGTKQVVGVCEDMTIEPTGQPNEYKLTITPSRLALNGWSYGKIKDPKNGNAQIINVRRLYDGQEIDTRNVWITHATMRDGKKPLYENLIHIADSIGDKTISYLITYEDRPAIALKVASYEGVPDSETYISEKLTDIQVVFNKPINEATFTNDDLQMMIQGNIIDVTKAVISKIDDVTYNINITNLPQADGLHILTVQTKTIDDAQGYYGDAGKQCSWNQFTGEPVELKFTFKRNGFGKIPDDACVITDAEGKALNESYPFASKVQLMVTPAFGYNFDRWAINGTTLSNNCTYEYTLTSSKEIELWFTPNKYQIELKKPSEGLGDLSIGSGQYEFGEELEIIATPAQGYVFDAWYEQSETTAAQQNAPARMKAPAKAPVSEPVLLSTKPTLVYTVKGERTIYPTFKKAYTLGDVNEDGTINAQDAQLVIQHYLSGVELNESAADVNEDGKINSQDAQLIIQMYINK